MTLDEMVLELSANAEKLSAFDQRELRDLLHKYWSGDRLDRQELQDVIELYEKL